MCITNFFYHGSWLQVFHLFQLPFFQAKSVNFCEGHVTFHDIEHQLQENIIQFLYKLVVKLSCIFNQLKTEYRQLL